MATRADVPRAPSWNQLPPSRVMFFGAATARPSSVRGSSSPMCDKCEELDKKIEHYRRIRLSIGDQITVERIEALIGDLQAQKAVPHPEQKQ
jgi:hypothetical protein